MTPSQQRPRSRAFDATVPGRPSTSAAAWAWIAVALVAATALWMRLAEVRTLPIDRWWHGAVEVSPGSGPFAVAVALADIGGVFGVATCGAIAAAALLALKRTRDAVSLLMAMVLGLVANEGLKLLASRPRPSDPHYPTSGLSFPSGHSMGAAVIAVSLLLAVAGSEAASREAVRWAGIAAVGWILVMMWSRTALHGHWITDVFAGALLGSAVAVLARRFSVRDGTGGRPRRLAG